MSRATKENSEGTQRILLKSEDGVYALDLSHLITPQQHGSIEFSLSPPSNQKLIFQTAGDYNVSLSHQDSIGLYMVTGDADNVADFLRMVQMLPEGTGSNRPIIIKSNVQDMSSGNNTEYKIFLTKDATSGNIKTFAKQDSAGQGVSQVTQIGSVFTSQTGDSPLKDINFSIFDMNASTFFEDFTLFEESPEEKEEDEIFTNSTSTPTVIGETAPSFTSAAMYAAEENTLYSYIVTATDANNDPLTINSTSLPSWLTLTDNGDGTATLSGTPSSSDTGFGNDVVLTLTDGTDTVTLSFDIFTADTGLLGTTSGDVINDGNSARFIHGNDGDDTINANSGSDVVLGGRGNDSILGGSQSDMLYGNEDNDTIEGGNNEDTIDGGAGMDSLTGDSGKDAFTFSDITHSTIIESDIITDYTIDDDVVIFTDTNITGIGNGATQITITDDGLQTFLDHNGSSFRITLDGVYSDADLDLLFGEITNGTSSSETIIGGDLGNIINTEGGNDFIESGDGDDLVRLGSGRDTINAGAGDDTISGASQSDVINGETGNDSLIGGSSNDFIDGGDDADILEGGSDDDVFIFSDITHSTTTTSDRITDYTINEDSILISDASITDISQLTITDDGSQTFIDHNSSSFSITLDGVFTASDLDLLFGDVYYGTTSSDTIIGGNFGDLIDVSAFSSADSIDGGGGNDLIYSGAGSDTVDGGAGNDTITATSQGDNINGGDGDDQITSGNDDDTIDGGAGQDTLTGGDDEDTFVFSQSTAGNDDHITDFGDGNDVFALSDTTFAFNSGDGAKDGVTLVDDLDIFDVGINFTGGNFGSGSNITFMFDTTDNELWYDADGSAGGDSAVLIFTLDNSYSYDADDFEGWM